MPRAKKITKKTIKKKAAPKKEKKAAKPKERIIPKESGFSSKARGSYFEAIGRRKTAIARVRLFPKGEKEFLVNNKPHNTYFPSPELQQVTTSSLEIVDCLDKFKISAKVRGGGFHAQAEALRHGISRALVLFDPDFRKTLKKAGFLTRDARMRERKKFGLKRARRAPQWRKR